MPVVSTVKMTARQYVMLGDDPPGVRLELVDGEIAVSASPLPRHSYVEKTLSRLVCNHVDEHDLGLLLGDTDTIFGEHDVRRPDLIYFSKGREHLVSEDRVIDDMPDLCAEIISPSSGTIDRRDKFEQYAAGGVPYYWIVDPHKLSFEGFKLEAGEYVLVAQARGTESIVLPPLPGLTIQLGKLWFPTHPRKS